MVQLPGVSSFDLIPSLDRYLTILIGLPFNMLFREKPNVFINKIFRQEVLLEIKFLSNNDV